MRKDSTVSTMSAIQLPVAVPANKQHLRSINRENGSGSCDRCHPNASTNLLFKSSMGNSSNAVCQSTVVSVSTGVSDGKTSSSTGGSKGSPSASAMSTVRRIKSTALEIACQQPSVSNLTAHPNSVEAINGQQQIRNPPNAILPPPSKTLVRNQHLNLCATYDGNLGDYSISTTSSSLDYGSTSALLEPVVMLGFNSIKEQDKQQHQQGQKREQQQLPRNRGDKDISKEDGSINTEEILLDVYEDKLQFEEEPISGTNSQILPQNIRLYSHQPRKKHETEENMSNYQNTHCIETDVGEFLDDNVITDTDSDDNNASNNEINKESRTSTDIGENNHYRNQDSDNINEDESDDCNGDDNDDFKDFDYDVDHILHDLQQTQNQLDEDLRANNNGNNSHIQCVDNNNRNFVNSEENTSKDNVLPRLALPVERERLHSTDSETDINNAGSRSPLLSNKNNDYCIKPVNRTMSSDDMSGNCSNGIHSSKTTTALATLLVLPNNSNQQRRNTVAGDHYSISQNNTHNVQQRAESVEQEYISEVNNETMAGGAAHICGLTLRPNEVDSGCPSSDCEQLSSSSKDMLLGSIVGDNGIITSSSSQNTKEKEQFISNGQTDNSKPLSPIQQPVKCLGAIPKNSNQKKRSSIPGKIVVNEGSNLPDSRRINCNDSNKRAFTNFDDSTATIRPEATSSSNSGNVNASLVMDMNKMFCMLHESSRIKDEKEKNEVSIAATTTLISRRRSRDIIDKNSSDGTLQAALEVTTTNAVSISSTTTMAIENMPLSSVYRERSMRRNLTPMPKKLSNGGTRGTASGIVSTGNKSSQSALEGSYTADMMNGQSSLAGCESTATTSIPRSSISGDTNMIVPSSSSNSTMLFGGNRNVNSGTTISLQGLFLDFSDELRAIDPSPRITTAAVASNNLSHINNSNGLLGGGASGISGTSTTSILTGTTSATTATTTAVLNVDGNQLENYCDYWRPAATCMLGTEKLQIPIKTFYKYRFKCFGYAREFKVSMDRLELLALFDRDLHWFHIVLSVCLSAMVALLGAAILKHDYYKDIFAFLFCIVIAGSQYSLLKSVQPDAASPIHGFNKTVAYSRAIYFCSCAGLLLLIKSFQMQQIQEMEKLQHLEQLQLSQISSNDWVFFGIVISPLEVNTFLLDGLYMLLLGFPIIFSLGLFPQINTFLMYLLEQIDMNLFGGNAAGSLLGNNK